MKIRSIAHLRGLSGPLAFAFDTRSEPGKIIVHSVRFDSQAIPAEGFDETTFKLIHQENDARMEFLAACCQGGPQKEGATPLTDYEKSTRIMALKAEKNIAKWGTQDPQTLALAIAEESGEVAQAVLKFYHEGGEASRISEEAVDLGALCIQMLVLLEITKGKGGDRV